MLDLEQEEGGRWGGVARAARLFLPRQEEEGAFQA